MQLGPLHENDPAIKIIKEYEDIREGQNRIALAFAVCFGKLEPLVQAGVEIDLWHWNGKRYVARVEYVGTRVEYNTVALPIPRDLPPPPLYNGEQILVPVWDHLGHTLAVRHIWEKEAEHEVVFLHCLQCDKWVGKTMRRRIVES